MVEKQRVGLGAASQAARYAACQSTAGALVALPGAGGLPADILLRERRRGRARCRVFFEIGMYRSPPANLIQEFQLKNKSIFHASCQWRRVLVQIPEGTLQWKSKPHPRPSRYVIPVVRNTFQIIGELANSDALTLNEAARRTGIPKSTAFRILATYYTWV